MQMIRYILTCIGLLAVLFGVTNIIGGAMWNMAEQMQDWWNGEEGSDEDGKEI